MQLKKKQRKKDWRPKEKLRKKESLPKKLKQNDKLR